MEIIVRGKHFEVPEQVEARAREKLGKLSRYLPILEDATVEVDLTHEKAKEPNQRYVVHVTVSGHGVHLQAEERAAQPEMAVDQVAHALTRQAERHKEKLYGRGRRLPRETVEAAPAEEGSAPAELAKVARVKRFAIKPMTATEALEQMEMLGHDFFLFHDADEGQFALLYRRQTGDYGMIIPELA